MKSFIFLLKKSLKFVPNGPIDNEPAPVQIVAWRRIGDKRLSEPMLTCWPDSLPGIQWHVYAAQGGDQLTRTDKSTGLGCDVPMDNTNHASSCYNGRNWTVIKLMSQWFCQIIPSLHDCMPWRTRTGPILACFMGCSWRHVSPDVNCDPLPNHV